MFRICSISSSTVGSRALGCSSCPGCSCFGGCSCSANPLTRLDLLRVDLLERRSVLVAGDLPLGRVLLGHAEERRGADLVRDRRDPFEQLLDPRAGGDRLTALEVDELTRQPVADRAPEVLLEQAVRQV